MNNNIINISTQNINSKFQDKITNVLSKYTEIIINEDKTVLYKDITTDYFLENNDWYLGFFGCIEQFKNQVEYNDYNRVLCFPFNNKNIAKEIKFIVYNKLFSNQWSLKSIFSLIKYNINKLSDFLNIKYPNLTSLQQLDLQKANVQWIDWLENENIKLKRKNSTLSKLRNKNYIINTNIVNFLVNIINLFNDLNDEREEWLKDKWGIRKLEAYGINYNKADSNHYLNFNKINNLKLREIFKKYIKQKLIANNKFSWSTASTYLKFIPPFLNYMCKLEPFWNDLKELNRHHIEKYLEWLNIYIKNNLTRKNANPKQYKIRALSTIESFLLDIQDREYDIAPLKSIRTLILPDDKPKVDRHNNQISYVPDFVLEQLFDHINNLNKDVIPIIYTMYKTGLRISDVLNLRQDCLLKLNNKYWITTDISKVYIKNHKIPIDDELANMLAVLIYNNSIYSNKHNNPENFIFVRYTGPRNGKPYSKCFIQQQLNLLAIDYNITDELGNIYHFKNHAFRHTYAMKMLNNGADIVIVQELLAHASPEMTMCYAKLLDDTKRKVFDNAVKQGVFSFDESAKLKEENDGEIPDNIIDMLYTNHKLNALDTPYGTCMQRKNGKCNYAKQPPCLTCNNGNPCKDLCIGAFEGDINKYDILINSTKTMIENAKIYNRIEMVNENKELLSLYENIYSKISKGNMIYSRFDKLKKKEILDGEL
mgnify:FL=1